jgi:hypothetical protein
MHATLAEKLSILPPKKTILNHNSQLLSPILKIKNDQSQVKIGKKPKFVTEKLPRLLRPLISLGKTTRMLFRWPSETPDGHAARC